MNIKRLFVCPGCGKVHKEYLNAQNCCPPKVFEYYKCKCGAIYIKEEDALKCHPPTP